MRRTLTVLLVGGSAAYALVAASTTPFTLPADILTGLAILGMAVLVVVRWPLGTRKVRAATRATGGGHGHPYLPWFGLFVVFVVWELFNYLVHGTRADHPTFSSITDAIDRYYVLKAVLFLAWMAGAWVIVRRGSRGSARAAARAAAAPAARAAAARASGATTES
jgi:hypothetical protein